MFWDCLPCVSCNSAKNRLISCTNINLVLHHLICSMWIVSVFTESPPKKKCGIHWNSQTRWNNVVIKELSLESCAVIPSCWNQHNRDKLRSCKLLGDHWCFCGGLRIAYILCGVSCVNTIDTWLSLELSTHLLWKCCTIGCIILFKLRYSGLWQYVVLW